MLVNLIILCKYFSVIKIICNKKKNGMKIIKVVKNFYCGLENSLVY